MAGYSGPMTAPWAPPEGRLRDAFKIADLIAQSGEADARAKSTRGLRIGNLVGNIGEDVAGVMQQHEERQQDRQIANMIASGQPLDMPSLLRSVGMERAKSIYGFVQAMQPKLTEHNPLYEQRDANGKLITAAKDPEPTPAERRAEAKAAKEARNEVIGDQMDQWVKDALDAGAKPEDVQRSYFVETHKAYPGALDAPKDKETTYTDPKPYKTADGKTVMLRPGSDGKMHDPDTGDVVSVPGLREYVAPKEAAAQPWQWVTRGSTQVYTNAVQPGDKKAGGAEGKPTKSEQDYANFYVQIKDALSVIEETEDAVSQRELAQIMELPQEGVIGFLNRNDVSENAKRYLRAFQQFTDARLRSASGKAVTDKEFERDRQTYMKQYGETEGIREDRRRSRVIALDGIRHGAGGALDDKDTTPTTVRKAAPMAPPPEPGTANPLAGAVGTRPRRGAGFLGGGAAAPVAPPVVTPPVAPPGVATAPQAPPAPRAAWAAGQPPPPGTIIMEAPDGRRFPVPVGDVAAATTAGARPATNPGAPGGGRPVVAPPAAPPVAGRPPATPSPRHYDLPAPAELPPPQQGAPAAAPSQRLLPDGRVLIEDRAGRPRPVTLPPGFVIVRYRNGTEAPVRVQDAAAAQRRGATVVYPPMTPEPRQ